MGSKNSKDVFNQLMDTIEELDAIKEKSKEKDQDQVIRLLLKLRANLLGVIANLSGYKEQVSILKEQVEALTEKVTEYEQQIALLREDNERMKRILSNDSSNSSIPPSLHLKVRHGNPQISITVEKRQTKSKVPNLVIQGMACQRMTF